MSIFMLMLMLGITLGFFSQVFPFEKKPSVKKAGLTKAAPIVLKAVGSVIGYNWQNFTFTIATNSNATLTIIADKNTQFSKSGKKINMLDVKKGDAVTINYEFIGGKNVARFVLIKEKNMPPSINERMRR